MFHNAARSRECRLWDLKYLPADSNRDSLPSYGMQKLLQQHLLGACPR